MTISIRNADYFTIIDIHSAEIDFKQVKILKKTLFDLLKSNKNFLIINMSFISSIDSSFLECLITMQNKFRKKGGELCVYGVQSEVLMIFYIVQLDKYIHIYNSEFDALNNKNMLVKRRFKLI